MSIEELFPKHLLHTLNFIFSLGCVILGSFVVFMHLLWINNECSKNQCQESMALTLLKETKKYHRQLTCIKIRSSMDLFGFFFAQTQSPSANRSSPTEHTKRLIHIYKRKKRVSRNFAAEILQPIASWAFIEI